mmetsp:Transcript_22455/g.53006  ORF Transcript_22455/g.53006 Transcript_22455/m.53006 type:complete len:113 (-) Transcript_22455:1508-1846(-)
MFDLMILLVVFKNLNFSRAIDCGRFKRREKKKWKSREDKKIAHTTISTQDEHRTQPDLFRSSNGSSQHQWVWWVNHLYIVVSNLHLIPSKEFFFVVLTNITYPNNAGLGFRL